MPGLENLKNVKHGKNIFELKPWRSLIPTITNPMITAMGAKDDPESNMAIGFAHITKPDRIGGPSHKHPFDQYIFLIGTSDNFVDFDADVELELDGKVHKINYPFYAFVPAGMAHCPIVVKRVGKPIVFIDARLTKEASVRGPKAEVKEWIGKPPIPPKKPAANKPAAKKTTKK
jgi:hypothetical protein